MSANQQFADKVALVTGAASGIGRATALAFAAAGAKVIVADLEKQSKGGEAVVADIAKAGGEALFLPCDVSVESEVNDVIRQTVKKYDRLDIAYNNAGTEGLPAETHQCTLENWDRVINTNLRGVWFCMKAEIDQMLKQGGGVIVNCASIAGLVGFQNLPAYTASKHGVIGLTRTAALEYAQRNIRVNAVCPGVIDTPMVERFVQGDAEAKGALASGEPVGRIGAPEEIASAVLWLSSDGASFTTGQALAVDGGWVAQ